MMQVLLTLVLWVVLAAVVWVTLMRWMDDDDQGGFV